MNYDKKIEDLRKQLNEAYEERNNAKSLETSKKYNLNIGDVVEFPYIDDDDYEYRDEVWKVGPISSINDESVRVDCKTEYLHCDVKKVRKFVDNDYTLRHKIWDRPLEPGDKIQIIIEKEDLTVGNIYEVESIFRNKTENYSTILNDKGETSQILPNEFHHTHHKPWK